MKFILFILIISMNVWSHEDPVDPNCQPVQRSNIQKLLDWWGAEDKEVEKAPCKTKSVPTESEIDKLISSKATGSTDTTIHGVNFKNESPVLIKAFRDFTTAKDRMGFKELPEKQKEIQKEFQIDPECDKVLCAMEKIWGKDFAKKMLYIKLKHNFNTSELAFDESSRFASKDLDDVIMGLEDLPKHLSPLGYDNQRLTHFTRGYTLGSSGVVANAVVMLFDLWDDYSSATKQYTIFHELAHNVSTKLQDMDESPEWLKLSGWVKKGDEWDSKFGSCFISKYGKTNPWEDYAETLSTYRYNASYLKSKCPEKYNFVKSKVFKGVEYTDVKLCSPVSSSQLQIAQKEMSGKILDSIGKETFSTDEIKAACNGNFSKFPLVDKEVGACSLKLHSSKVLNKMSDVLKKAGIPDTAANRELVVDGLAAMFGNDEQLSLEINNKSKGIGESITQMVQKEFDTANPKGFSIRIESGHDYRWTTTMEECGGNFFTGKVEDVVDCQLKAMIKEDRSMQRWNIGHYPTYTPSSIFADSAREEIINKREETLLNHLKNHPATAEALIKEKEKFRQDLTYHQNSVEVKLNQMEDWKKMSPEDFCSSTYGTGSEWTKKYGITSDAKIPKIYDRCVEEQSKKSKRFEFKNRTWKSIVDSL